MQNSKTKLPMLYYRQVRGDMTEMYKILSGKYDTAVTPRVMREHSYIKRGQNLRLRKVHQNMTCANTFLLTQEWIFGTVYLMMLCYVTLLINLNPILINSGNIETLCMIIKLKFTEPDVKVHITKTSYIGYQYFVSFVFVKWALACARNSSTSTSQQTNCIDWSVTLWSTAYTSDLTQRWLLSITLHLTYEQTSVIQSGFFLHLPCNWLAKWATT